MQTPSEVMGSCKRYMMSLLGLNIIKDPDDERVFIASLMSSKIACGITVSAFLIIRQFMSYSRFDSEAGLIEGCQSDVSHSVTGSTAIGSMLLVMAIWLTRRFNLKPMLQDLIILTLQFLVQFMVWYMISSRSHVMLPEDTVINEHGDVDHDHVFCSENDFLTIEYNRMIVVSMVIGCGFVRARLSWLLTVVWTLAITQELIRTGFSNTVPPGDPTCGLLSCCC